MTSAGSNAYRKGPCEKGTGPCDPLKLRLISTVIFFSSFKSIKVPSGPINIDLSLGMGSVVNL